MANDLIANVRSGLNKRRENPGWLTIASESGVRYSTIWRLVHEDRDPRASTVQAIADWLSADDKKRARA
jgi:predicted transcriptional regulator